MPGGALTWSSRNLIGEPIRGSLHIDGSRPGRPAPRPGLGAERPQSAGEPGTGRRSPVEGPPDADALIPLAGREPRWRPPVALLVYRPEKPSDSVYYPFAEFSPEWQAIQFALARGVPVRFMDLPVTHWIAKEATTEPGGKENEERTAEPPGEQGANPSTVDPIPETDGETTRLLRLRVDPLAMLGGGGRVRRRRAVVGVRRRGPSRRRRPLRRDPRRDGRGPRTSVPPSDDLRELRREAHMRQTIRAARTEGHRAIAVVCGAWHAPALAVRGWPRVRDDAALLKGLPKTKVAATWVPWTYGRLAIAAATVRGSHRRAGTTTSGPRLTGSPSAG